MSAVRGWRAAAFLVAGLVTVFLPATRLEAREAAPPTAGPIVSTPTTPLPATSPPPPLACSAAPDDAGVDCDVQIVADGQSHSIVPVGSAIPDVVGMGLGYPVSNVAIGGASWSTLLRTVDTRLTPVLDDHASSTSVLLMIGGTTDIVEGDTAATVYSDAVAYATAARSLATGPLYIVVATIPPAGPNLLNQYHFTAAEEAVRVAANALILADESGAFDAAVDIAIAPYDDPTDPTYFQVDRTHLTQVAARGIAEDIVIPAIEAMFARPPGWAATGSEPSPPPPSPPTSTPPSSSRRPVTTPR